MKKILLGCTAVLLSLGLLAGCNDDEIIDPDPTIVDDDGPEETTDGTDDSGSGKTELVKLGVYWAPSESEASWYYFSGSEDNYSDIGTTTEWDESPWVTVTGVSGGATLSFTDSENKTQYLTYPGSGVIVSLDTKPYTWGWNNEYKTFSVYDTVEAEECLLGLDNADLDIRVYPISRGFDKYEVVEALAAKPEE